MCLSVAYYWMQASYHWGPGALTCKTHAGMMFTVAHVSNLALRN